MCIFSCTSYLTFHEGSLLDSQTHSCQCECLCTVQVPVSAHTHTELLTEYRHDKEEQDSPQSIMERLLYDSAGCSRKAFDMQMYLAFWAYEEHIAESSLS